MIVDSSDDDGDTSHLQRRKHRFFKKLLLPEGTSVFLNDMNINMNK